LIHRPFVFNADDTSSEFGVGSSSEFGVGSIVFSQFAQFAQNSGRPISGLAADVRIPPCVVARDPTSQAWGASSIMPFLRLGGTSMITVTIVLGARRAEKTSEDSRAKQFAILVSKLISLSCISHRVFLSVVSNIGKAHTSGYL